MNEHIGTVQSLGELGAYRDVFKVTLEALRISLAAHEGSFAFQFANNLELRLKALRGEKLYPAPIELDLELQAAMNRSFQNTYSFLCDEIIDNMHIFKNS